MLNKSKKEEYYKYYKTWKLTEKFYIEKVNVVGNSITSERVLRNQLLADEGDPFNEILVNKSFNNIKSLGLFKNVETNIETSKQSMTKTINIETIGDFI